MPQNNNAIPDTLTPIGTGPAYRAKLCRMLKKTKMFESLSSLEIETLGDYVEGYTAEKGTAIFIEGAPTGCMCILIEGKLEIFKDSVRGATKKITEISPGTSIGEMSIIDGLPRSATTLAVTPVTLVALTQDELHRLIEEHPKLGAKVLWRSAQVISQRLRKASSVLADYLD